MTWRYKTFPRQLLRHPKRVKKTRHCHVSSNFPSVLSCASLLSGWSHFGKNLKCYIFFRPDSFENVKMAANKVSTILCPFFSISMFVRDKLPVTVSLDQLAAFIHLPALCRPFGISIFELHKTSALM